MASIQLQMTEETENTLDKLQGVLPQSQAQQMRDALALAQWIIELEQREEPLILVLAT